MPGLVALVVAVPGIAIGWDIYAHFTQREFLCTAARRVLRHRDVRAVAIGVCIGTALHLTEGK